jgi:alpha 1,2-mannosyltransferase
MRSSMESVEAKFNRKFGYPWVFLNEEPFTEDFKKGVLAMTRSEVIFHQIPQEHWSYPADLNLTQASEERQKMVNENVICESSLTFSSRLTAPRLMPPLSFPPS